MLETQIKYKGTNKKLQTQKALSPHKPKPRPRRLTNPNQNSTESPPPPPLETTSPGQVEGKSCHTQGAQNDKIAQPSDPPNYLKIPHITKTQSRKKTPATRSSPPKSNLTNLKVQARLEKNTHKGEYKHPQKGKKQADRSPLGRSTSSREQARVEKPEERGGFFFHRATGFFR
ncbi:hypothetical protein ACE6H2_027247 [Prunus campanulata]